MDTANDMYTHLIDLAASCEAAMTNPNIWEYADAKIDFISYWNELMSLRSQCMAAMIATRQRMAAVTEERHSAALRSRWRGYFRQVFRIDVALDRFHDFAWQTSQAPVSRNN